MTKDLEGTSFNSSQDLKLAHDKFKQGDVTGARKLLEKILIKDPQDATCLYALGVINTHEQNYARAQYYYRRALKIRPDYHECLLNIGNVCYIEKNFVQALKYYQQALKLQPNSTKCLYNMGNSLCMLRRFKEALPYYKQALRVDPKYVKCLNNLGVALAALKQYADAITCYKAALNVDEHFIECYKNIGNSLLKLYRFDQAEKYFQAGLKLEPRNVELLNGLGLAYKHQGRIALAQETFEMALKLQPQHPNTHYNLALILLLTGKLSEGWHHYEWRHQANHLFNFRRFAKENYIKPGTEINNKKIIIVCERSYGDCMHYCRYIKLLKVKGAYVIVQALPGLKDIIGQIDGVDEVIEPGTLLPNYDYFIPLLSLPWYFNTDLKTANIDNIDLKIPKDKLDDWRRFIYPGSKLNIGIVWIGGPAHPDELERIIPIPLFASIINRANIDANYYSLILSEKYSNQLQSETQTKLFNITSDVHDFLDTAAIISQLDLIISVDASLVHLAGALNKPCWVLLPYIPDWCWMLEGDDSPWYPSIRLFREQHINDWQSVVDRVVKALEKDN